MQLFGGLRHPNFNLLSCWLALLLLCDVIYVKWMRSSHENSSIVAQHTSQSSSLRIRLIHISPRYWTIYRFVYSRMGTVNWIRIQTQCCMQIHGFKTHWICYEKYFFKCLIAGGTTDSNGWARVNLCVLGSFTLWRYITASYWTIYCLFEIILEWEVSIWLEFKSNVVCKSIASKKHSIWYVASRHLSNRESSGSANISSSVIDSSRATSGFCWS